MKETLKRNHPAFIVAAFILHPCFSDVVALTQDNISKWRAARTIISQGFEVDCAGD
jgi:hypothetical protein